MNNLSIDETIELTDLEPNCEVVGGTGTGALVNVSGTNTWERATTNNQGRLIVGVDSVKL